MDWNNIAITSITVLVAPMLLAYQKHKYDSKVQLKNSEIEDLKMTVDRLVKEHDDSCSCDDLDTRLIFHPYFARMKCLIRHITYDFTLENKGKEAAIRDIMVNKFNTFIIQFADYAKLLDETESMTADEFLSYTMDILNKSIDMYTSFFIADPSLTAQEKSVLVTVMNKFNIWHNPRIDETINKLHMIAFSNFYPDHKVKGAAFLDMLLGEFVGTITDADNTAHSINGSLSGLVYKGITI